MKHLIFIFAVIFATLAVLPCPDAFASEKECDRELSAHEADDRHQDETANDLCSPFCSCQCCHLQALIMETFIMPLGPLTDPAKDQFIPTLFPTEYITVWHPPKV